MSASRLFQVLCRHLSQGPKQNYVPTVFDKIISREIPANIVYEDKHVIAFKDIDPKAPVHILLIPKNHEGLINLNPAEAKHKEILGYLMLKASEIAKTQKLEQGWRLIINNGDHAGQTVYHLHLHILGGRDLSWPPG